MAGLAALLIFIGHKTGCTATFQPKHQLLSRRRASNPADPLALRGTTAKEFLSLHEQQILVRQETELTLAVAAVLPLARRQPSGRHTPESQVEPIGVPFGHDEVVEVRCYGLIKIGR